MVAQFPILKSARVAAQPTTFKLSDCEFSLFESPDGKILGRLYAPGVLPIAKDSARKIVDIRFGGKVILFESSYADYRHLANHCKKSNVAATRWQTRQLLDKLAQRQWAQVTAQPAPAPVKKQESQAVLVERGELVMYPHIRPVRALPPAREPELELNSSPDYSSLTRKELAAIAGVKLSKQTKAQLIALISAR